MRRLVVPCDLLPCDSLPVFALLVEGLVSDPEIVWNGDGVGSIPLVGHPPGGTATDSTTASDSTTGSR
jgi:hypothetical protein